MTKRSTINQQLQQQREHLQPLLEISPTAIVISDLETTVVAWNPAAERLFGYTAEEAIGRNLDDLVATTEELHTDAVAYSERTSKEKDRIHTITRRTTKDGTVVDVELMAAPLVVDEQTVGILGIYHDITELQRQKQYYAALLEMSPTAITTVDPDDNLTSWNPAAERLFGYTAQEAIGRNVDDLVANRPEIRQEALQASDEVRTGEIGLTTRRTRKDGSLVDVTVAGGPIHVAGELVGAHAFYHDISELQQQKRWNESVLELSPTAIVTIDGNSRVTSWNPAAERLFGYSAEEAIGSHIDDLVATADELREEAARYSAEGVGGEQVRVITRRTRKDGSLVDVEMLAAPVLVGGERVGHSVIYHDIGEIQRQKRYLESLLEISPAAIVVADLGSKVSFWNPAAEKLFGYTADEAVGRHLDDLVATRPELHDEAVGISRAAARGELVQAIARRTRKDGSLVDVQLVQAPVVVNEERIGFLVIYIDISELQRQKRYYEALVQSNPVAIALLDLQGTVNSWNPSAERLFGYRADEAIGRNIDDLVATSDQVREEALSQTERGMSGDLVHSITRRTRKDGSLVDVEIFGAPVIVAGQPAGLYAMYHDINELQRARRDAEAATEAKSAFLATMSHEIRTPLNAVIGMTGLLLDTALAPEQRSYAEVIRGSGDALLGVINDILDFSKIEAGRLDLERAPFDLRECLESALELGAAAGLKKGLDIAYELDPAAPGAVVGDETRLRQIIINLLNNAVKFTERGEVVLTVTAEQLDGDRYRLLFSVRDTGIGIPEDRMDRLFESFSQVDPSTTRRYGGTGLGLAISKRLVEVMGGTLGAESRVGAGSTFHFAIEAEAAPSPVRGFEQRTTPHLEGRRVLIVDDNAANRHILVRQTQAWGMIARDTESPAEALEWIRRMDPFDVAILDMQMPEMDGLTLAGQIRLHRDARTLPLVMLTSLGRTEQTSAEVEFAAYLTKPIKPSQLFDALLGVFGVQPELVEMGTANGGPDEELAERRPLRILVVEDNAVNQQLALLLLQKVGYRADVAANGVEALEALERQPYDVVLMDVEMPEMDGLEATRRIHQRWSKEQRPRIIAVTANAMAGERELCFEAGMDDYIAKPIRIKELTGALDRTSPRAPGRGEPPPLDPEVIARLAASFGDGGGEFVGALIDTFLDHAPGQLASLRNALERADSDELRRAAHTLKSNAATFGATSLAEVSRELEDKARAGELDGGAGLLARLERELSRVEPALRAARQVLAR